MQQYADQPTNEVIHLKDNFRSSSAIVSLANHVIRQNTNRIDKPMVARGADNYIPIIGQFENEQAQAQFIAQQITTLVKEKRYKYTDIAVLIRSHAQTPSIEHAFSGSDIPYGGELFWSQPAVSQVLNILYAVASPHHPAYLPKAINTPTKVMSNLQFQDLCSEYEIRHLSTTDQIVTLSVIPGEWDNHESFRKRCKTLFELHKTLRQSRASQILSTIITDFTPSTDDKSNPNELPFIDATKRLLEIAMGLEISNPNARLQDLLNYVKLLRSEARKESTDDKVQIITCHHAKGLEFPVVFVVGVQPGIFPNDFFIQCKEDLEAERRLFYVAITRAKQVLYITSYLDANREPSQNKYAVKSFLDDLPEKLYQPLY